MLGGLCGIEGVVEIGGGEASGYVGVLFDEFAKCNFRMRTACREFPHLHRIALHYFIGFFA